MYDESKSEGAARVVDVRPLADPAVRVPAEVVLVEAALDDVDRTRGDVVVVVPRVLRVEPADEPEIEMRVAVQLEEVARVSGRAGRGAPRSEARRRAPSTRLRERLQVEIGVLRHARVNPLETSSFNSAAVLDSVRKVASATASPKRGLRPWSARDRSPARRSRRAACRRRRSRGRARARGGRRTTSRRRRCRAGGPRPETPRERRRSSWNGPPPARIAKTTLRRGQRSTPSVSHFA